MASPPRSLHRSAPEPWCVLDATKNTAVMRCKRCRTEEPVHFPMDLRMHKSDLGDFLHAHRLCGLGLHKLYERRRRVQARMNEEIPSRTPYPGLRRQLALIELTIERLKKL